MTYFKIYLLVLTIVSFVGVWVVGAMLLIIGGVMSDDPLHIVEGSIMLVTILAAGFTAVITYQQ